MFIATPICPPLRTAPEKKRNGLLCCLLALLRKSWTKCWISEYVKLVLSFLQNRRARLGSYFSRTHSSESGTHIQLLFLWDGRVTSDTLNVFVSWQLHNISWQHVVVSRFYIIYPQSKTVHRRFSFPRVAFCVDFVSLYWTFLVVRHSKHFQCNGSYIPWIVSWTSFGLSFIEFEVLLPCGSFDKVLRLPNTFVCAPCSLVTRNGLCCWTITCLKALPPWNFPRDPSQIKQNLNIFLNRLVAHAFPF